MSEFDSPGTLSFTSFKLSQRETFRFWSRVDKNGPVPEHATELGPCWIWTRGLDKPLTGYGQISLRGKNYRAHRISFSIFNDGLCPEMVCHRCDNKRCVRPDHLFGSDSDGNISDMLSKGRQARGERQHLSRFSREDVLRMRKLHSDGVIQSAIAAEFDTCQGVISNIVLRKTWKHV